MPFLLYERTERDDGTVEYFELEEVSLAGRTNGLVYPFVKAYAPRAKAFPWGATVGDLLREAGTDPGQRAVVAALRPTTEGNLSLYELTDVFGYSYQQWTPLCLRMEALVVDQTVPDPERFKRRFRRRGGRRPVVHQFLYLQGGLAGGTWKWGPVGSVNGVLLWPDALSFFLERLSEDD
ncbi:MAG: hypothetical protein ACODAJ_15865 [Planctomycetota bacterium]